ncbi:hypothetical protein XaFJ1_GM003178 [Xanthomonas albilineans]|nr:hypothetical protein XaFJ1_GM003178 [Xanthomonas albilineans]
MQLPLKFLIGSSPHDQAFVLFPRERPIWRDFLLHNDVSLRISKQSWVIGLGLIDRYWANGPIGLPLVHGVVWRNIGRGINADVAKFVGT